MFCLLFIGEMTLSFMCRYMAPLQGVVSMDGTAVSSAAVRHVVSFFLFWFFSFFCFWGGRCCLTTKNGVFNYKCF